MLLIILLCVPVPSYQGRCVYWDTVGDSGLIPLAWKKVWIALHLSGGSFAESASGGSISSGVLQSGVVDVGKLILSDHGSTLGELAGLKLHLGVIESRDHVDVEEGEDGLGEQVQDTVEDWRTGG